MIGNGILYTHHGKKKPQGELAMVNKKGSMINVVETHYVSCNIYFFVRKEVRSE